MDKPPATVAENLPVPADEIEPGHPGIVETFEDEAGEYRFRIKGGNGETMATSEGYTTRSDAKRGYETLSYIMQHSKTEYRTVEKTDDV